MNGLIISDLETLLNRESRKDSWKGGKIVGVSSSQTITKVSNILFTHNDRGLLLIVYVVYDNYSILFKDKSLLE